MCSDSKIVHAWRMKNLIKQKVSSSTPGKDITKKNMSELLRNRSEQRLKSDAGNYTTYNVLTCRWQDKIRLLQTVEPGLSNGHGRRWNRVLQWIKTIIWIKVSLINFREDQTSCTDAWDFWSNPLSSLFYSGEDRGGSTSGLGYSSLVVTSRCYGFSHAVNVSVASTCFPKPSWFLGLWGRTCVRGWRETPITQRHLSAGSLGAVLCLRCARRCICIHTITHRNVFFRNCEQIPDGVLKASFVFLFRW